MKLDLRNVRGSVGPTTAAQQLVGLTQGFSLPVGSSSPIAAEDDHGIDQSERQALQHHIALNRTNMSTANVLSQFAPHTAFENYIPDEAVVSVKLGRVHRLLHVDLAGVVAEREARPWDNQH